MITVFISGRISGMSDGNHFAEAAKRLHAIGCRTVNPFGLIKIYGGVDDSTESATAANHSFWMRKSLALMMDCDAIYFTEGWEKSKGAIIEHDLAERINMEIITDESIRQIQEAAAQKNKN